VVRRVSGAEKKAGPPIGVRPEMHHELCGREGPNGRCSAANP
jgi:hypothetical protein